MNLLKEGHIVECVHRLKIMYINKINNAHPFYISEFSFVHIHLNKFIITIAVNAGCATRRHHVFFFFLQNI